MADKKDLSEQLDQIQKAAEQSVRWRPHRVAFRSALWFALPFLACWGFGLDPATAARAAVFPWAIATVVGLIAAVLVGYAVGAMIWVLRLVVEAPERGDAHG